MSFLSRVTKDPSLKEETDTLGGFSVLNSDVYTATINHAICKKSDKGSEGIEFEFTLANGQKHFETIYCTDTNGSIIQEYDGKKSYRKGYLLCESIALLTTGKSLTDLEPEQKYIEIYNKEAGAKVPIKVPCLTDLHGKQIKLAIFKVQDFKRVEVNGKWEPSDEVKESNTIDKAFRADDNLTVHEIRNGIEQATFMNDWLDTWKDKVKDKTKGKTPKAPMTSSPKPTKSLFG